MAADIDGLSAEVCNKLIDAIHSKEFPIWERKLYCRGISTISPIKRPPGPLNLQEQVKEQESEKEPDAATKPPVSKITAIPGLNLEKRLTKAQRKKAERDNKTKRKVNVVKTPGAPNESENEEDEEFSEDEEEVESIEDKKDAEDQKAAELRKAKAEVLKKSSGINPKDVEALATAAIARIDEKKKSKKHKLSPQQEERPMRSRSNSSVVAESN